MQKHFRPESQTFPHHCMRNALEIVWENHTFKCEMCTKADRNACVKNTDCIIVCTMGRENVYVFFSPRTFSVEKKTNWLAGNCNIVAMWLQNPNSVASNDVPRGCQWRRSTGLLLGKVCMCKSLNTVHGSVRTFRMEELLVENWKNPALYVGKVRDN